MAKQINAMFAELRKEQIVNLVQDEGKCTVTQLCKRFEVSQATIRNDLAELDERGLIRRAHGGAIRVGQATYEPTSLDKADKNLLAKQAIAKAALQFATGGTAIAIDTGTTTLEFAKQLRNIPNLTVVTNDLQITTQLEHSSGSNVYFLGGILRRGFHCTVGNTVIEALDELRIDTLFLATNSWDPVRGLSTPNLEMAKIKQKLISVADTVILLVDKNKLENRSFALFAAMEEIDIIITDAPLDYPLEKMSREHNVRIISVHPVGDNSIF